MRNHARFQKKITLYKAIDYIKNFTYLSGVASNKSMSNDVHDFVVLKVFGINTRSDPVDNSSVEESLRISLCPDYATVLSAKSPSEPSLGSPNATCKTHRRRL